MIERKGDFDGRRRKRIEKKGLRGKMNIEEEGEVKRTE